jgi:hypothetical protein
VLCVVTHQGSQLDGIGCFGSINALDARDGCGNPLCAWYLVSYAQYSTWQTTLAHELSAQDEPRKLAAMDHSADNDQSDPAVKQHAEAQDGAAGDVATATGSASPAAAQAASAVEPLVFGELEDEDEKFHTPLTGSRASSGNLDTPPAAELAAFHIGSSTTAAPSVLSEAAVADAAAVLTSSSSATAETGSTAEQQHPSLQAGDSAEAGTSAGAATVERDIAAVEDAQPPQLSPAAAAAAADASKADAGVISQQQQVWSQGSGLVTLSQLAAGQAGKSDNGHSSGSGSDSESDNDSQSEVEYADYQLAGAAAAGEAGNTNVAATAAAGAMAADQAEPHMAGAAVTTPSSVSSSNAAPATQVTQQQQQQQQQQEAANRSRSSSPLQHQRLQHIQQEQQQHRRALSPPRSPLSPRSPASGLERSASWQLQHAAAAAAGTAAHAAPPRSDLHLARLG